MSQRLLETLREAFEAGRDVPMLCLAIAAWMRYVGGVDEAGTPIDVRDPLADRLRSLSEGAETVEGRVAALLGVAEVFPADIADQLRLPVTKTAIELWKHGAREAVLKALN